MQKNLGYYATAEEASLCYARASRALQPERQLSYQLPWQPSPQLQTDRRPMPGPAETPGSVYNSTPVTAVREWPAPHPHFERGPTPVQIWNEGREQSYFADLLQDELDRFVVPIWNEEWGQSHFADLPQDGLDRFPTTDAPAPQLQLTSAAMPAPPAPTAAPPPVRWAPTWMLPVGTPIDVPMPLQLLAGSKSAAAAAHVSLGMSPRWACRWVGL